MCECQGSSLCLEHNGYLEMLVVFVMCSKLEADSFGIRPFELAE